MRNPNNTENQRPYIRAIIYSLYKDAGGYMLKLKRGKPVCKLTVGKISQFFIIFFLSFNHTMKNI
jgi:hypothetical protein